MLEVPAQPDTDKPVMDNVAESDKTPGGPKIWDRRMVSAAAENTVNRLKKALSTDARKDATGLDPLSRTHPLRVRIDGLQRKAAESLEAGDLEEAKDQAERAVELSASLALEFLPNEEHPDELLRRITVAIDELDQPPTANPQFGLLTDEPFTDSDEPAPLVAPTLPAPEADLLSSTAPNTGTVAANRPLRLASQIASAPLEQSPSELVEIGPILADEARSTSSELLGGDTRIATSSSADRLRLRNEAGPLLITTERRPLTTQVAEAAPLPPFRSAVTPRQAPTDVDHPASGFEWADLWPLGVLGMLLLCFATGLTMRRLVTGH